MQMSGPITQPVTKWSHIWPLDTIQIALAKFLLGLKDF